MEQKTTYKCNKCGYECQHGKEGTHKPDGFNFCIGKMEPIIWVKSEQITKLINERIVYSERLNIFGAEFDNKMKSQLRKAQKIEPTCLVATYFRELRNKILD